MKKVLFIFLGFILMFSLVACKDNGNDQKDNPDKDNPGENEDDKKDQEKVLTYAEYIAAADKSEVIIETYIQAKQSWWEKEGQGVGTFYTMDDNGGYFIYEMPCTKDDYDNKLTIGAHIKVKGTKSEWSGEVEIADATWELLDGTKTYTAKDITNDFSNASNYQNQFVAIKGLEVVAFNEAGDAFGYKWNGTGEKGDDIYFNVKVGEQTLAFTIESYLCDQNSDVYKAAESLKVGDVIDLEGFMYWYEGPQPHVTKITVVDHIDQGLTADKVHSDLVALQNSYLNAKKAGVKISAVNGEATMETTLVYEINSDGLYESLQYEYVAEKTIALYIKGDYVYNNANDAKNKETLSDDVNETMVSDYGIAELLKKVNGFYDEAAFYAALTLVSDEEGVAKFDLDLTSYNGKVFDAAGKDKIELIVTYVNDAITNVKVEVTKGSDILSTNVSYLGFDVEPTYPEDLASYTK